MSVALSLSRQVIASSLAADFNFLNGRLPDGLTFSRASGGTRIGPSGSMELLSSNSPRFDYDPVTKACLGIWSEEARTNLVTHSSALMTGSTTSNAVHSASAVASPTGGNFTLWTRNSTAAAHGTVFPGSILKPSATNLPYAGSIYAKAGTGRYCALRIQGAYPGRVNVVFDLQTGTISSAAAVFSGFSSPVASITPLPDGVYRLALSAISDTGANINLYYSFSSNNCDLDGIDSSGSSSGYVDGVQFEAGLFPTSLIPTSGAAATRALEMLSAFSATGLPFISVEQGTLYIEAYCSPAIATFSRYLEMNHNSLADQLRLAHTTIGSGIGFNRKNSAGTDIGVTSSYTPTVGELLKVAVSWSASKIAIAVNGTYNEISAANPNTELQNFIVGNNGANGVRQINNKVRILRTYKRGMFNEALTALTR